MLPIPPFLVGPLCGAAGMALAGLAAWGWLVLVHDPGVRAAQTAEIAAAVAAQQARDHEAATAALEAQAAATAAQIAALSTTRQRIARAPVSTACAAVPAIRDALDGVRALAGGGAPAGAGQPAGLPAPARAP